MYIHNLNPVALNLGFVQIYWYGVVYVLGYLATYFLLYHYRERIDLTKKQVDDLIFGFLVGMLIGARLFHFLFNAPSIFWTDPLALFRIWEGGMSFFGSFVGISTAGWLLMKRWKKDFWKMADLVVLPVTAALVLGRLANFVNGELWGRVTDLPWCVVFPAVEGCRHPYPIYASLAHFLLFGGLLWWYNRKHTKGVIFFAFAVGYSALRFLTDFFREDPSFLGLTNWQWVSLVVLVIALIWYKNVRRS